MRFEVTTLLLSLGMLFAQACQSDEADEPKVSGSSPDTPIAAGTIAFVSDRDGNDEIYSINADGTRLTNLTNDPADDAFDGDFAWSPDGTKLVFVSIRNRSQDIYSISADGSGSTRLTSGGRGTDPDWSPDGQRLAYVSLVDMNPELFVMNADGSGQTRLTDTAGFEESPSWSPDGEYIAYVSNGVWVIDADGFDAHQLTSPDDGYYAPVWSPDGKKLVFEGYRETSDGSLATKVLVIDSDGSGLRELPAGANLDRYYRAPTWSPDGQLIAFASNQDVASHVADIYVMSADGSGTIRLTDSHNGGPAWSPDGAWIAVARGEPRTPPRTLAPPGGDDALPVSITPAPQAEPTTSIYILRPDGAGEYLVADVDLVSAYISWQPNR